MVKSPFYVVFDDADAACHEVAAEISRLIRSRATTVLGLATGSTPLPLYQELIRLHREEGLSFGSVTSFNLDEYLGLKRNHPESYWSFMRHHAR
jgi:glucosamine-6-phosphate deaminase